MFRFFKDFIIYGIASVIAKIIGVFLMPVYTSILSQEDYGAMAMIIACKGIIDLVSNLNIHSGIARDYYETYIDRQKLVSTGLFSILFFSFCVLFIMFASRKYWINEVLAISNYSDAFTIMLFTIPAGSLLSYFSILTRFKQKPLLFSIGSLLQLLIQIIISIYGVVILRLGIVSVFIGVLSGELFGILYFALINRQYIKLTFSVEYLKRVLIFALPTLPAILAGWVDSSLGQIFIGKYVSMEKLGIYSVALQLASVFTLVYVALQNVWSPYLYENYKKANFNSEVTSLYILLVFFIISISITLSLLSKEIILLLSNENYLEATKYLSLLCIPMGIYLLLPIVSSGVSLSRDTKYIGFSYVVGSIINVLLLIMILPFWGIMIVPIALGISRIVNYLILYKVVQFKGLLELPNKYILYFIILSVLCFGLVYIDLNFVCRMSCVFVINGGIAIYLNKQMHVFVLIKSKLKRDKCEG